VSSAAVHAMVIVAAGRAKIMAFEDLARRGCRSHANVLVGVSP